MFWKKKKVDKCERAEVSNLKKDIQEMLSNIRNVEASIEFIKCKGEVSKEHPNRLLIDIRNVRLLVESKFDYERTQHTRNYTYTPTYNVNYLRQDVLDELCEDDPDFILFILEHYLKKYKIKYQKAIDFLNRLVEKDRKDIEHYLKGLKDV